MKKQLILLSLLGILLLFSACHKKRLQPKPDHLISYEKMVDIVAEVNLTEAVVYLAPPDSNKRRMSHALYENIFKEYDITQEQFKSSLSYYLGDEEQANKLVNNVAERLKLRREAFFEADSTKMEK